MRVRRCWIISSSFRYISPHQRNLWLCHLPDPLQNKASIDITFSQHARQTKKMCMAALLPKAPKQLHVHRYTPPEKPHMKPKVDHSIHYTTIASTLSAAGVSCQCPRRSRFPLAFEAALAVSGPMSSIAPLCVRCRHATNGGRPGHARAAAAAVSFVRITRTARRRATHA
jgi:hypothetical protein